VASEIFSQSDIDALLGVGAPPRGEPRPGGGRGFNPDVQIYDFRRPHRISKDRQRTLEALYGRLSKSLESWLMGRVRDQVELNLLSVEHLSFGEFMLSLPSPCASFLFDVRDSGGQRGVLDFGHEFAYFLVDRLFGGSGSLVVPERVLSNIERTALRIVAERLLALLRENWQEYVPLELTLGAFESMPEILQAASREDPVLVANLEVTAAGFSSLLAVCLPFPVLESFFIGGEKDRRMQEAKGSERERTRTREQVQALLLETRADVRARFPEFPLSMGDLAALEAGSLLSTGIPLETEVHVLVGDEPRFRAAYGRAGGKLALQVVGELRPLGAAVVPSDSTSR
jgi:flagellar motor switch protein FliM